MEGRDVTPVSSKLLTSINQNQQHAPGATSSQQSSSWSCNSINRLLWGIGTYLLRHIIRADVEGCGWGGGSGGGDDVLTLGFEASGGGGMLREIEDSVASSTTGALFFFFAITMNNYIYSQRRMERQTSWHVFRDQCLKYFCLVTTSRRGRRFWLVEPLHAFNILSLAPRYILNVNNFRGF